MTKVAWQLKKEHLIQQTPGLTEKKFLYNLSRSSYEKDWGTTYQRPGIRIRLVALIVKIIPKIGPFNSLAFKPPTPETEKMFMASFNATVDNYRTLLDRVSSGRPELPNENFDVGQPPAAGKYAGTDQTYDDLLGKLADLKFASVSPELRGNMMDYYKDREGPAVSAGKKAVAHWMKLRGQLDQLQAVAAGPVATGP
jgi:hypothetical protein